MNYFTNFYIGGFLVSTIFQQQFFLHNSIYVICQTMKQTEIHLFYWKSKQLSKRSNWVPLQWGSLNWLPGFICLDCTSARCQQWEGHTSGQQDQAAVEISEHCGVGGLEHWVREIAWWVSAGIPRFQTLAPHHVYTREPQICHCHFVWCPGHGWEISE